MQSKFIYSVLKKSSPKSFYYWVLSINKGFFQEIFTNARNETILGEVDKNKEPIIVDDEYINEFYQFIKEITMGD